MLDRKDVLDLDDFLPYRLNRAAEAVSLAFARIYKQRFNMSRPEWRVFAIIGEDGPVTATEICARSSMDRTKVSRAVYALESRGWLSRSQDRTDRRIEHLSLTSPGRKVYKSLIKIAKTFESELIDAIGEQDIVRLKDGLAALEEKFVPK